MIIDCHSHIYPSSAQLAGARDFSCLVPQVSAESADFVVADTDSHLASCEPAHVTLVLGFVSKMLNAGIPNEFISSYVAAHPDKLIGFAGLEPQRDDNPTDLLSQLRQEQNFLGLTLSPSCQGFHPCHTQAMRLYEAAEKLAMPIYFLYGGTLPSSAVLEFAQPTSLDEVAHCFPHLKIVISHLGFPWIEQTITLLAQHPNIYADVAGLTDKPWQAYRSLTLAHEYGVIDKLLFASDFPSHTVKAAVEALYYLNKITLDSALPAVPREQIRSIVERDGLALLGLKTQNSATPKSPTDQNITEQRVTAETSTKINQQID